MALRLFSLILALLFFQPAYSKEKNHNYRFKIIRDLIKENKKDKAISRLKKIYKRSKFKKTRLKALLYLGRIYLSKGQISKAINYFSYFQKKENPEVIKIIGEKVSKDFSAKNLNFKKIKVSSSFLFSAYNEIRLKIKYNEKFLNSFELLEILRRKALILVEKNYKVTKTSKYLEKIESLILLKKRKAYKNKFFAGGSQNYFSKNFDLVSSSETLPMTYQAYGPKVNVGFLKESYFNGHIFTLSFSALSGEMSVENDSTSTIDYYVKNKAFYAFEGSYTYYFRVSENSTKFGVGIDLLYLTYNLSQPTELASYEEDNLALSYLYHFLVEYNYKDYAFFTKNSIVSPGFSLQSELGFKYLF